MSFFWDTHRWFLQLPRPQRLPLGPPRSLQSVNYSSLFKVKSSRQDLYDGHPTHLTSKCDFLSEIPFARLHESVLRYCSSRCIQLMQSLHLTNKSYVKQTVVEGQEHPVSVLLVNCLEELNTRHSSNRPSSAGSTASGVNVWDTNYKPSRMTHFDKLLVSHTPSSAMVEEPFIQSCNCELMLPLPDGDLPQMLAELSRDPHERKTFMFDCILDCGTIRNVTLPQIATAAVILAAQGPVKTGLSSSNPRFREQQFESTYRQDNDLHSTIDGSDKCNIFSDQGTKQDEAPRVAINTNGLAIQAGSRSVRHLSISDIYYLEHPPAIPYDTINK